MRKVKDKSESLSNRETTILMCIADGMTNSQIAEEMFLSEQSVKMAVQSITYKLGANNRAHAVGIAYHRGILRAKVLAA